MDQATLMNFVAAGSATGAAGMAFVAWRRARSEAQVAEADPESEAGRGVLRLLVSPLAERMRPTNQAELEQLTTDLLHAGRRSRDAVDRYLEERVLFLLGGLALALVNAFVVEGLFGFLLAMVSVVAGVSGPRWLASARATERRDAISAGLPSAVDLLTTCIDAGLSLENALARVARDLQIASPILAEELELTSRELAAGVSLPDALRRLARRVGLDDLSALCGVIAQAHGLGAPVGVTLREYAESSRRQRMSLLEERAGKVAAKLTIPLAVFFLPASMLVILGPAVAQLVRALQ